MFCRNCGMKMRDSARFCPKCGTMAPTGKQEETFIPPVEPKPVQDQATAGGSFVLGTESARRTAAADRLRDAFNGQTIQCSNCGSRLRAGLKFCPECGVPTGLSSEGDISGWTAHEGGGTAAAVKTKKKPGKKPIVIGVVAVLLLIIVISTIGGGGGKYADGLVEANNAYGLSTTITLDEFVELYNQRIVEINNIERGSNYEFMLWASGGFDAEDLSVNPYSENSIGLTMYQYKSPFGWTSNDGLPWLLSITVDSKTGYVVSISVSFSDGQYNSNSVSDAQRDAVYEKFYCALYAMAGGENNRYDKWKEIIKEHDSSQLASWKRGLVYSISGGEADVVTIAARAMTKDAYEKWSTNTLVE